ncbi:uncharacterized protein PG986_000898 [Apiospora aurea]|uniref:Uncharacterized protein n=1 Tax=Apiospora aurea TaxID=335848 RepID=A0ABR1QVB3_9PEZI
MESPDYLLLDPDELEEHHKYMLKTGLGKEEFLESEWNCMGIKLKNFLSFDGHPRVRSTTTPGQGAKETHSNALRIMRVLCCQIILPSMENRGPRAAANDSSENSSGTKGKEPPLVVADLLASIRERRQKEKAKEADEAFFRPRKVERYDWSKYDPDASDDDVDVWKMKSASVPDGASMASYEPCSSSEDGSSIHEPSFPSDFGSSNISLGSSMLMSPEQPRLPTICARTVPPVRSNRYLGNPGPVGSDSLSRDLRRLAARDRDPKPDREHTASGSLSVEPLRLVKAIGKDSSSTTPSSKSKGSTSGRSSSSVTSGKSQASTIRPGSSQRSEGHDSVITVIERPVTLKAAVSLSRTQSKRKARIATEPHAAQSSDTVPPPEDKPRAPKTARPRNHTRRSSLQMPLASPRIGGGSRPPLVGQRLWRIPQLLRCR